MIGKATFYTPTKISRSPAKWMALINDIKDEAVRIKVAGIVWWDYASKKHKAEWENIYNTHVDKITRDVLPYDGDIERELLRLGYSSECAKMRSMCKQTMEE